MKQNETERYVDDAARTDAPLTAELLHRLTNPVVVELLHASLGMVTEAAELADMLKKHVFANKPLDMVNAEEELGDELWYVAKAIRAINSTMADVMTMNIEKLRLRFPEEFSEEQSLNRDTDNEREFLESAATTDDAKQAGLSIRGQNWMRFAERVLHHIEEYTVPQYGDAGEDRVSEYDTKVIKENIERYAARMGSGARGHIEALRDCLKIAHYASFQFEIIDKVPTQKK